MKIKKQFLFTNIIISISILTTILVIGFTRPNCFAADDQTLGTTLGSTLSPSLSPSLHAKIIRILESLSETRKEGNELSIKFEEKLQGLDKSIKESSELFAQKQKEFGPILESNEGKVKSKWKEWDEQQGKLQQELVKLMDKMQTELAEIEKQLMSDKADYEQKEKDLKNFLAPFNDRPSSEAKKTSSELKMRRKEFLTLHEQMEKSRSTYNTKKHNYSKQVLNSYYEGVDEISNQFIEMEKLLKSHLKKLEEEKRKVEQDHKQEMTLLESKMQNLQAADKASKDEYKRKDKVIQERVVALVKSLKEQIISVFTEENKAVVGIGTSTSTGISTSIDSNSSAIEKCAKSTSTTIANAAGPTTTIKGNNMEDIAKIIGNYQGDLGTLSIYLAFEDERSMQRPIVLKITRYASNGKKDKENKEEKKYKKEKKEQKSDFQMKLSVADYDELFNSNETVSRIYTCSQNVMLSAHSKNEFSWKEARKRPKRSITIVRDYEDKTANTSKKEREIITFSIVNGNVHSINLEKIDSNKNQLYNVKIRKISKEDVSGASEGGGIGSESGNGKTKLVVRKMEGQKVVQEVVIEDNGKIANAIKLAKKLEMFSNVSDLSESMPLACEVYFDLLK